MEGGEMLAAGKTQGPFFKREPFKKTFIKMYQNEKV